MRYHTIEEAGDKAFNDLMHDVQQQFLLCKERTNDKFQKLEELIELAAQKLILLMSIEAKQQEKGFMKHSSTEQQTGVIPDSGHHLELGLSKFDKGSGVFEGLLDCEYQLAVFGTGNKAQKWLNLTEEVSAIQNNRGVFRDHAHADWDTYIGEPVYDEEPGEGQECWPEQEFILAAIKVCNTNSPNSLQSEGCYEDTNFNILRDGENTLSLVHNGLGEELELPTPEQPSLVIPRPNTPQLATTTMSQIPTMSVTPLQALVTKQFEKSIERTNVLVAENESVDEVKSDLNLWCNGLVPGHGDMPKIVGSYKVEEKQRANEEVSSMIPTNIREIVKTFHGKIIVEDFPTDKDSYGLGKCNFGEANVSIFDPGGRVQNDQSTCVNMFKEMIKDKVKLDKVAIINSACDQPRQQQVLVSLKFLAIEQEHNPRFVVQIVNSAGIQGQDIQKVNSEADRIISEINQ